MDHSVAVGRGLLAVVEVSGWPQRRDDVALWGHLERQHDPRFVAAS
jgi:hypothetical protein